MASCRGRALPLWVLVLLTLLPGLALAADKQFESPQVHPLELSPDGTRLFALNTPDHRLVIYDLTQGALPVVLAEIQVGIEPVTVRARSNTEVWVVNHISDSISIIDIATLNIKRTLLVGDEPTDVVFAGTPEKAYVCLSQLDRVAAYDTADLDLPPIDIDLDASDPFSLAVSPDGSKVYVSVLDSQNETTVVPEAVVDSTLGLPPPVPPMDTTLAAPPVVSLIVRHDGSNWVDELSRSWDTWLPYQLYDNDVFEIDASTGAILQSFKAVGTVLTQIGVNPVTGRLYVSNLESFNEIRFEPVLLTMFSQTRVTTIDPATATVTPVHLNGHINYGNPQGDPVERGLSLGLPQDIAVNSTGDTVYVASMGTNKVGVLDANGAVLDRLDVGQGPTGLALDEPRGQLYVLNRHFGSVSVVTLSSGASVEVDLGFDPTPITTQVGRTLFYSTLNSSGHGDVSCASCHIFGNVDGLAWDLGDPTGAMIPAPQPQSGPMHPMKGPLVTQTLRDLNGTLPLHWRGDRADLEAFNVTFTALQGRPDTLSAADFAFFKEFVLSMHYPPNPLRNLDGSLQNPVSGPNPTTGEFLFFNGGLVGGNNCDFCHGSTTGTNGIIFPPGSIVEEQAFETPQFRNMYEKTRFDPSQSLSVRGFGYTHEGDEPSIFSFTFRPIFTFNNNQEREDIEAFLFRFNTGTHSAVGQQLTMDGTNEVALLPRLTTLRTVAAANDAGLVAKGIFNGIHRGWVYDPVADEWNSDRSWEPAHTTQDLLDLAAAGTEVTFTAVVPGCETRLGVDRDEDGWLDREELDSGTDPGDPLSFPTILTIPTEVSGGLPVLARVAPNPAGAAGTTLSYRLDEAGPVQARVYDVQGRLVRNLVDDPRHPAGAFDLAWNLTDEQGARVSGGIYFVKVVTTVEQTGLRLVVLR